MEFIAFTKKYEFRIPNHPKNEEKTSIIIIIKILINPIFNSLFIIKDEMFVFVRLNLTSAAKLSDGMKTESLCPDKLDPKVEKTCRKASLPG